ncbi:MAG: hypothetical protein ABJB40_07060, partial [Acidobacteriota bacterium]
MTSIVRFILLSFVFVVFTVSANAQVDEICTEAGFTPSLDSPFAHVPYVFGRVILKGADPGSKLPRVTITLTDSQQPANRMMLSKSGNYCFKRTGSGGTLLVEVDGLEAARRTLASMGGSQQREDFEIAVGQPLSPPAVVSTKFSRPPNSNTVELYRQASEAEKGQDLDKAVAFIKEIVSVDAADFGAWAKLGSLFFEQKAYTEADAAFRKSLELRVDYTPAWINVGQMRVAQKQYAAATEIFKHAAELEPTSARAFQLLGEAYLLNKQG